MPNDEFDYYPPERNDYADREAGIEEARNERQQAYQAGVIAGANEAASDPGFGCGCFFGIVLTFVVIYMGWCSPYPFGH